MDGHRLGIPGGPRPSPPPGASLLSAKRGTRQSAESQPPGPCPELAGRPLEEISDKADPAGRMTRDLKRRSRLWYFVRTGTERPPQPPGEDDPHGGIHPASVAVRLWRARAAHRRQDDGDPSHEAPPGVCDQPQQRAQGASRPSGQDDRGPDLAPGRAARIDPDGRAEQRRRARQSLDVLADHEARRRRRANRGTGPGDHGRARRLRRVQGRPHQGRASAASARDGPG